MQRKNKIIDLTIFHIIVITCLFSGFVFTLNAQQLAFPGAEGYGRFTEGGRGGKVIEVTNLNDSGSGSFRSAVLAAGARTVVFRVSGTITLKSNLDIRNPNITIAGQTAPGDGICVRNYPIKISTNNVIIRYVRCRLGDEAQIEDDAMNGRNRSNIIIDHCSLSWSVDECGSFYDNTDFTLQWCILSESLYHSVHDKGNHGYGGIWGGKGASFHHNILAHHTSRNPRFCGSRYSNRADLEKVDFRNNVIFNWGGNSGYAGEGGTYNLVNNYYKPGPATSSGVRDRIFSPNPDDGSNSQASGIWGLFYVAGNYMYDRQEVTDDNWLGIDPNPSTKSKAELRSDIPFDTDQMITFPALVAYQHVLANAGTVLPNRDSIDERIVNEIITGTPIYGATYGTGSGIIDTQSDVGGWPVLNSGTPPTDADQDGMADDWEIANGLSDSDPEDRNGDLDGDGYTNLEEYINSLCERDDFILSPAGLSAIAKSPTEINLTWQEICDNETGFIVERSEGDTTAFSEIARVDADQTSYSDAGLTPATTYYYRIQAYNETVSSLYSEYIAGSTINANGTPLAATNPQPANDVNGVDVITTLAWTGGAAATSHDLYFGTTNPPEFVGNFTANEFDPRGLSESTVYYWRLDAINDAGKTTGEVWSFTTASYPPTLTAYWPFDRGIGTIAMDNSGNRTYAYLKNMVNSAWVDGVVGKALEFDGEDDYLLVNYTDKIDFSIRSFTVSFWVKLSSDAAKASWASRRIYENSEWGKGYEVYHNGTDKVIFNVSDGDKESLVAVSKTAFPVGEWVFVTAIRDRTTKELRLYANAQLQGTGADSTYNLANLSSLYIGSDAEQNNFYSGMMDDFRLYDYALSDDELASVYNGYATDVENFQSPKNYALDLSNYPNPFNPVTNIVYSLPARSDVKISVFNMLGQEVMTLVETVKPAGIHKVLLDASRLNSGVYFYRLTTGNGVLTRKMILIK